MFIRLTQQDLRGIFLEQDFTREQQEFFVAALQNDDPTIAHKYFVGNVDIDGAFGAEEQGDVIGPPMGIGDYLAPLHFMLAAGSDDPARTQAALSECFRESPSTEDEVMAGKLGVYTLRPILNVFQSYGFTIEDFNREYKVLVQELGGAEMVRNNEAFQRRVQEMLAQVAMEFSGPSTIQIEAPDRGPTLGIGM